MNNLRARVTEFHTKYDTDLDTVLDLLSPLFGKYSVDNPLVLFKHMRYDVQANEPKVFTKTAPRWDLNADQMINARLYTDGKSAIDLIKKDFLIPRAEKAKTLAALQNEGKSLSEEEDQFLRAYEIIAHKLVPAWSKDGYLQNLTAALAWAAPNAAYEKDVKAMSPETLHALPIEGFSNRLLTKYTSDIAQVQELLSEKEQRHLMVGMPHEALAKNLAQILHSFSRMHPLTMPSFDYGILPQDSAHDKGNFDRAEDASFYQALCREVSSLNPASVNPEAYDLLTKHILPELEKDLPAWSNAIAKDYEQRIEIPKAQIEVAEAEYKRLAAATKNQGVARGSDE